MSRPSAPRKWALSALVLLLTLGSCSEPTGSPQAGSNTNWLKTCETVDDCEGFGECVCGYCTQSCQSDADCTIEGSRCAGEATEAATLACRGSVSTALCLPACVTADDCAAEQACIAGTCVPGCDHSADEEQAPYAELVLPGTIELEDFDRGGQCVAYWDREEESQLTGSTRQDEWLDVHSNGVVDGSDVVGFAYPDEWAEYTVDVKVTGTYQFELWYSAETDGGQVRLELDGQPLGELGTTSTGSFNELTSTTLTGVAIEAGKGRVLRVRFGLYVNHDRLDVTLVE